MPIDPKATSSYLQNLPAIFGETFGEEVPFLGRFLLAFEQVLTGLPGLEEGHDPPPSRGLEEIIATLATLFDPKETREEFLPWLANWVALGLRADWTVPQQRNFLANIVPLYRRRGTKENLAELLRIYTGLDLVDPVTVVEDEPHFFRVSVTIPNPDPATFLDPATLKRQEQIATALIDLQKPAHTDYTLEILHDTIQIGVRSTIGVDTLLGSLPPPDAEESRHGDQTGDQTTALF